MLQLAAAVERQATHPVAKALVAAAAADRNAAAAASTSSSSSEASDQQQLLQERRDSHAAAGTSSSSRGADSKQHRSWRQPPSSSKGSSNSQGSGFALSASAVALLESGRLLEPESGTFRQEPGSGAVAVVSGHKVSVGTLEWVQRHGAQLAPAAEQVLSNSTSSSSPNEPLTGHTQVYVGVDGMVVGLVDVADVIRPDARSTVQELHAQGIKTIMLSGEHGWSGMRNWHESTTVTAVVLEHTPCSQYMLHGMNFLAVGMQVPNPCVPVQYPCWHTQWHWLVVMQNYVSDTELLAVLPCYALLYR
jgi:Cu2+-exporting ATPase